MIEIHITNIQSDWDYDTKQTNLRVFGRRTDGTPEVVTVRGFLPTFFMKTTDVERYEELVVYNNDVVSVEDGHTGLFGEQLSKVTTRTVKAVKELADVVDETFEADVWLMSRFRIDLGIYTGIRVPSTDVHYSEIEPVDVDTVMDVLTFDIETDDRGAFPELGERRILSLVAHSSLVGDYVGFIDLDGRDVSDVFPEGKPEGLDALHYYPDEAAMLDGFAEYVNTSDVDILTGWNISDFDAPYLLTRCELIGVDTTPFARFRDAVVTNRGDARLCGRHVYDLLPAYKRTKRGELSSYSLQNVALAELGEEKLDHSGQGIYEMWESDADKLMRYNFHDVRLVVDLNDRLGILRFYYALKAEVGADLHQTQANNSIIEMLTRRKLHAWGLVAPTAHGVPKDEKYEGAHVVDPYTGVTTNVVGMDLDSLYPYTMWMLNASPETRIPEGASFDGPVAEAPNGARFRLDDEGLFTALVDEALDIKRQAKADKNAAQPGTAEHDALSERYDVRKTIVNSLYGTLGWEFFFLYDEPTAEAVTTLGQKVIKATQTHIDSQSDARVIYGDTDSNYIEFDQSYTQEETLARAGELKTELNGDVYQSLAAEWGMGDRDCKWNIVVESYASVYFQAGKKKRYAMHVTWQDGKATDKKKITGFDTNRSDTAQLTNDLMTEVLYGILDGADSGALAEMVYEYAQILAPGETPPWEYIGIPQGYSKPFHQYDNPTAHVRGAQYMNAISGTNITNASKPMRVYLTPRRYGDVGEIDVLCFEEPTDMPEWATVDSARMLDTLIIRPVSTILDAVQVDTRAAASGQVQTGLGRFL